LTIHQLGILQEYGGALIDQIGKVLQQSGEDADEQVPDSPESELDRRLRQLEQERGRINDLKDQLGRTNKGDKGPRKSIKERLKEARDRFKGHAKALRQKFDRDVGPTP
jgi:ElaB/YqjD/DUF883 family membrane-anchored ribosome-binding protein